MRIVWLALAFFFLALPAMAQNIPVFQSGLQTPRHAPMFLDNGVIGDSGPAGGGALGAGLSELNITNTGTPYCINDVPVTDPGGYHQFCLGANVSGQFMISMQSYAGAPVQGCIFNLNGSNFPCFSSASGIPIFTTMASLQAAPSTTGAVVALSGYYLNGDKPVSFYTNGINGGPPAACALNAGAGDGGSQVPSSDGKCWWLVPPGPLDVRHWGAGFTVADSGPSIRAAITYSQTSGGAVYIPSGGIFTITSTTPSIGAGGLACLNMYANTSIYGDKLGGVGSGGLSVVTIPSTMYCATEAHGIAPPDTNRYNNQFFRDFELIGHAPLAPSGNTLATVGIYGPVGSSQMNITNVHVKNFVVNYVPTNILSEWVSANSSQQDGYQCRPDNGYPAYGILYGGIDATRSGQLQGHVSNGGSIYAQQISSNTPQLFNGDGSTTAFTTTIPAGHMLCSADGLAVTLSGVTQTLGTQYTVSDATPGAPSPTIYGKVTGSVTFTKDSFNFTAPTGLPIPTSYTTGTGMFPVTPWIHIRSWGLPVGSYVTAYNSGTGAGTFDNPDHLPARASSTSILSTMPTTFAEGNIGGQSGCGLTYTVPPVSNCGGLLTVTFATPPPSGTNNVKILWSDPTMLADVSLKTSASFNRFDGMSLSSADIGFEDTSLGGNNVFNAAYEQFTNQCVDIWTKGDTLRFAGSSGSTNKCPGYFGDTSSTNTFTLNSQLGSESTTGQAWIKPDYVLLCGNFMNCPFTDQASQSVSGIANTPVYVADGWWGVAGASSAMTTDASTGLYAGSNISLKWGRPAANTNTSNHCVGQTIRTVKSRTLGDSFDSLSLWLTTGANFSGTGVNIKLIGGTDVDEGTASLLANTWTGQVNLLDVTEAAPSNITAQRYNWSLLIPSGIIELAIKMCYTPTGTAGANDFARFDGVQLESAFLAGPLMVRSPAAEAAAAAADYEQSYANHVAPGTITSNGERIITIQTTTSQNFFKSEVYSVAKNCSVPTITLYSPGTGTVGNGFVTGGIGDEAIAASGIGVRGFEVSTSSPFAGAAGTNLAYQYTASCRL